VDETTETTTAAAVATLDAETTPEACACGGTCDTCSTATAEAAAGTVTVTVDDKRTFSDILHATLARAAGETSETFAPDAAPLIDQNGDAVAVPCAECAKQAGAFIVEINLDSTPHSSLVDASLQGRARDLVPLLLET
jgi:hypothetical protein